MSAGYYVELEELEIRCQELDQEKAALAALLQRSEERCNYWQSLAETRGKRIDGLRAAHTALQAALRDLLEGPEQ